ncbi:hypothetical protein BT96DRAFT_480203 [Gymnopus androsaceus JB14]|uniref:Uncharacterized protein n=1 Tax=Gymnopus androsaceus JB14 TaxID=1447944 RepID=A0A6A4HZX2_9AGAR|nr:hypothetical protein BT96DRAFT_480203 [Gymnopus androsaceus JB14]
MARLELMRVALAPILVHVQVRDLNLESDWRQGRRKNLRFHDGIGGIRPEGEITATASRDGAGPGVGAEAEADAEVDIVVNTSGIIPETDLTLAEEEEGGGDAPLDLLFGFGGLRGGALNLLFGFGFGGGLREEGIVPVPVLDLQQHTAVVESEVEASAPSPAQAFSHWD